VRLVFLSSTPLNALEGSGTFTGIRGLALGLGELGHSVTMRPLGRRTGFHTLDRWLYNVGLVLRPPAGADLVVGLDLDGFLWGRGRRVRFVVGLKGIIADELRNERGLVRALLSIQAGWERRNAARADVVVVPSGSAAAVAADLYGVSPHRLAVVPEPIELSEWDAEFARAPRRPRGPADGFVVLCVARMYPRKRIVDLLHAAARLGREWPGARVRIVGRGPEWEAVGRLHRDLALGERAVLLGDVSRAVLAEEYVNADAFCLPSVQESFGIVFLEAMAAGLPIVACRVSAMPEVVPDGEVGDLVPPRDPEALAAALRRLAADPARARALGEAGRRRVQAFTPRRVAEAFLAAVESRPRP
jgi:glycosyltransferase involved in cell wall biosynthesis